MYGNGESRRTRARAGEAQAECGGRHQVRIPSAAFGRIAAAMTESLEASSAAWGANRRYLHLHNAVITTNGGE
jgi:hypothetical protein